MGCMSDHFDKIQKLPDPIPGVPNFRRVPGFKVYCCGQPTIEGFEKALEKVCGTIYPKDGPIIWFNLCQEPTVYVNGNPICARPPNKIGEYAELGAITRDIIKAQETAFLGECEGRKSTNGGKLKVVDVNKKESEVEVKELKSLSQVIEGLKEKFPGLIHWRVPVCNSASPLETDYDIICKQLVGTAINTPIIVMTRLVSPEPPLDVSCPASSRSSRSLPLLKDLLRLFQESMPASSRLTGMSWMQPRMPCSEESLRLSSSLCPPSMMGLEPRTMLTRSLT